MPPKYTPPPDAQSPQEHGPRDHAALRLSTLAALESLAALKDVNERCIETLARDARSDRPGSLTLTLYLKDLLSRLTPETRKRAARRGVLLTDLEFANPAWWRTARDHPTRPAPLPSWRGSLPKPAALQLTRATLMLAWHSLRSSGESAVLFGMTPPVAQIIAELPLTEIELLVERRFRHLRPRWEDRPAVWRALLLAAESDDSRKTEDLNLYSLQLVTGGLWTPLGGPRDGI